ncbi:MAG: hypothetical protein U9Q72_00180 [Patescibacteria group bacterium]|nr:hypothetical protein [Patescibacteria group bacterium]
MKKFIGNEGKIKLIEKIAHSPRPEGSYIIAGPKGTGKKDAVAYFIKLLLGDQTSEAGIPAGAGQVYRITPKITKKIEKKKEKIREKDITVGQIREAISFMNLKSLKSSFMVCVIERAEKMHVSAQNALLKSLEEPKRGNVFLLVTESERKLLPTIQSRSAIIKFGLSNPEKIFQQLIEEGIAQEDARKIAYYSWGKSEYSQKLMENRESLQVLERAEKSFLELIQAPLFKKMGYLEQENDSRKILQKVDLWISFLLANLEEKFTGDFSIVRETSRFGLESQEMVSLLENFLELRKKLKYTNASPKLALEVAWL